MQTLAHLLNQSTEKCFLTCTMDFNLLLVLFFAYHLRFGISH